jgi:hypothetical protein
MIELENAVEEEFYELEEAEPRIENSYVVEWSEIQGCFHIETTEGAIRNNFRAYVMGNPTQYFPVSFASSHSDATRIIKLLEEERSKNPVLTVKTPELIHWRNKFRQAQMEVNKARIQIQGLEMVEYQKRGM